MRLGLLLLAPAVAAGLTFGTAAAGPSQDDPAGPGQGEVEQGRTLFLTGCAGCHGAEGDGTDNGPTLRAAGEALTYYYLSTGRMPLANPDETPRRKPHAYDEAEIDDLVAFVESLGTGPHLPEVRPEDGDLAEGGELFRAHCAPCHSAAGVGGALSYGRAAPNVHPANPLEIGAAVRSGPGQMPLFDEDAIGPEDLDSLVAYVEYLDDPDDRGGLPLGRVGPIPEGFVTWVVGVGALLLAVGWIGTRMRGAP